MSRKRRQKASPKAAAKASQDPGGGSTPTKADNAKLWRMALQSTTQNLADYDEDDEDTEAQEEVISSCPQWNRKTRDFELLF